MKLDKNFISKCQQFYSCVGYMHFLAKCSMFSNNWQDSCSVLQYNPQENLAWSERFNIYNSCNIWPKDRGNSSNPQTAVVTLKRQNGSDFRLQYMVPAVGQFSKWYKQEDHWMLILLQRFFFTVGRQPWLSGTSYQAWKYLRVWIYSKPFWGVSDMWFGLHTIW